MIDDKIYSCPKHAGHVIDGCEACRVISQDILSCPEHPLPSEAPEDCVACNLITEIWADVALAVWKDCEERGTDDVISWAPGHEPEQHKPTEH